MEFALESKQLQTSDLLCEVRWKVDFTSSSFGAFSHLLIWGGCQNPQRKKESAKQFDRASSLISVRRKWEKRYSLSVCLSISLLDLGHRVFKFPVESTFCVSTRRNNDKYKLCNAETEGEIPPLFLSPCPPVSCLCPHSLTQSDPSCHRTLRNTDCRGRPCDIEQMGDEAERMRWQIGSGLAQRCIVS